MICLVDTHVWLWMECSPTLLSPATRELLSDPDNEILFSAASSWEIAVKYAAGRLALPEVPAIYIPDRVRRGNVIPVPLGQADVLRFATLPRHQGDAFDRMIIAQAQLRDAPIVTGDPAFDPYDVDVIRA